MLEYIDIERCLVHRYPFLFVDRVLELEPERYAVGHKLVTRNEWFFQGHFPGQPVMPGVLIVEALAQLAAIAQNYRGCALGKTTPIGYLAAIRDFKFQRVVQPGDVLVLRVDFNRRFGRIVMIDGVATVDGHVAASGQLLFSTETNSEDGE